MESIKLNNCNHLCDQVFVIKACVPTFFFSKSLSFVLDLPYFPAHKTHRPIRRTVIFSLEILEKNNDECILILVIFLEENRIFTYQN